MQWACILFGDSLMKQHQMPLYIGICWCSFLTGVTENIIDWFSQTVSKWLLWFLTTRLPSSQKLQVNLDLPVFLVPLSCWSSCNIMFVLSQKLGLVNYSHSMHTVGHTFHCLAQCGLCTFQTGLCFPGFYSICMTLWHFKKVFSCCNQVMRCEHCSFQCIYF